MEYSFYFFNTLVSESVFRKLFDGKNLHTPIAAQKFFYLLAAGLSELSDVTVNVVGLLPVNSKEQKKIFWNLKSEKENKISFSYIPIINIPILRNVLVVIYLFFKIMLMSFPKTKNKFIVVDFLKLTINFPVIIACKIKGIKIIAIATDLPGIGVGKDTLFEIIKNKIYTFFTFDYYVSLTQELNNSINTCNKPNIIIEGFADLKMNKLTNNINDKFKERVIIYAGGIHERYGLKDLVEAFALIPDPDIRLWIFGEGPFVKNLDSYSQKDSRISYKGFISNTSLLTILNKATLLVNPRPTHELYTKYSFPSKNLEYMSTGTPLLTTRLPGIPNDHYPFIYLIEKENVIGIRDSLVNVLKLNKQELHDFGSKTKAFVLENKNNVHQASKIISFLHKY